MGNDIERFVHLNTHAEWFVKGAGGKHVKKGELKAVNVLEIIRDRLEKIYDSEAEEDAMEEPEEVDPMEQLNSQWETPKKAAKKAAKRSVATKTWGRSLIEEIDMPRTPEGVALSTEVTKIVVYTPASGQHNFKKRPIYLRVDALDWLLQFAADEHFCRKANCAAVAGLNLEWDCTSKAWQAELVSGPLKGTKRRFGVYDLTKDRANKMEKAGILQADTTSGMESYSKRKQQARDVLLVWCDAISRGDVTFEEIWDLPTETDYPACTLVKKARKSN